jgi:hypothetical protein
MDGRDGHGAVVSQVDRAVGAEVRAEVQRRASGERVGAVMDGHPEGVVHEVSGGGMAGGERARDDLSGPCWRSSCLMMCIVPF